MAFAMCTHQGGVLKPRHNFPLKPAKARGATGTHVSRSKNECGGQDGSALSGMRRSFSIEDWDNTNDVKYRVCHGEKANSRAHPSRSRRPRRLWWQTFRATPVARPGRVRDVDSVAQSRPVLSVATSTTGMSTPPAGLSLDCSTMSLRSPDGLHPGRSRRRPWQCMGRAASARPSRRCRWRLPLSRQV